MTEPGFEEKMREEWNRRAGKSFMQYTSGTQTESEQDYLASAQRDADTILKYLGGADTKSWRAIDLGCGVGRIMQVLAPRFGEIHGVDVSDEMLRHAKERLKEHGHVRLHRIEGKDLKLFPDAHFDVMWSYSVLYHMPRELMYGYVRELGRVMKPGGVMVYQLAQLYSVRRWLQAVFRIEPDPADYNVRRFYTKGHLQQLAAENGFEVLACEPGYGHDLWNHWRKKQAGERLTDPAEAP
jgi:cyclopropane fatty-acyl-phospholipid synthase-like methyltransferase